MAEENPISRRQLLKKMGAGVLGLVLGNGLSQVPDYSLQTEKKVYVPLVAHSPEKIITPDQNKRIFIGIRDLRSSGTEIVGDNTGTWGMSYTKPTNIGLDLISTMVAESESLISESEATAHLEGVLEILQPLKKYNGLFPEFLRIEEGKISPEVKNGEISYSSIDSGWLTFALSLIKDNYLGLRISDLARNLISSQDYSVFLDSNGLMGAGLKVNAETEAVTGNYGFSYDNKNSEARAVVLSLIGLGKIPETVWEKMFFRWTTKEDLQMAEGWHYSAFVELTGNVFFDEEGLAPKSFGKSHKNYVQACSRIAQRSGYQIFGWAPCMNLEGNYQEYGLDETEVVTPYAAALLSTTEDPESKTNFKKVLDLTKDKTLLPDALVSSSGNIGNDLSLTLDQNLLFLAANKGKAREIVHKALWYPVAQSRFMSFDNSL